MGVNVADGPRLGRLARLTAQTIGTIALLDPKPASI